MQNVVSCTGTGWEERSTRKGGGGGRGAKSTGGGIRERDVKEGGGGRGGVRGDGEAMELGEGELSSERIGEGELSSERKTAERWRAVTLGERQKGGGGGGSWLLKFNAQPTICYLKVS